MTAIRTILHPTDFSEPSAAALELACSIASHHGARLVILHVAPYELAKGGFMIFDDFREGWRGDFDFTNLQQIVGKALPKAKWVQLSGTEPIFHSFFDVDLSKAISGTSAYGTRPPSYWGIYENNDPKKRLMIIANVDDDIGESWQYSATGFVPIAAANETYKLGINYVIYALTH